MPPIVVVAILLTISNLFMTYAWYGHLKDHAHQPLWIAVLVSWGVAFFEYAIQVPANRFGNDHHINLGQLKILQEVITLAVFVPFAVYYMNRPLSWNFLWAGLCMLGAVYFIFNDRAAKPQPDAAARMPGDPQSDAPVILVEPPASNDSANP